MKLKVITLLVIALATLSFTFIKVHPAKPNEAPSKKILASPIGGFVINDKL